MRTRNAIGALAVLLLAGCATKLVYQRLDYFIGWRLNDYVTFDDAQQRDFKQGFGRLWKWHRAHELPRYAQDFREMAKHLDGRPVSAAAVAERSARFQGYWAELMEQTLTGMCGLVRTFDDAQVRDILEGVDEDIDDFRKEYVQPSEKELRSKSEKRTAKWIKRWTGPLNEIQEALLRTWGEKRLSLGTEWLAQRQQWRAELEQALSQRRTSLDCAVFWPLFVTPMDGIEGSLGRDLATNERLWNELIAEVIANMDDRQRQRARDELEDLAGQLEQLSAMEK